MTASPANRRRRFAPTFPAMGALTLLLCSAASAADDKAALHNISIKNLTNPSFNGGMLTVPSIEIVGTNVTEQELRNVLSDAMTPQDRSAFYAKLKAEKIDIPEIDIKNDRASSSLKRLHAEKVSDGAVGSLTIAGFQITAQLPGATPGTAGTTLKSGPIVIENVDIGSVLSPVDTTLLQTTPVRNQRVSATDMEISVPDKTVSATAVGGNILTLRIGSFKLDGSFSGQFPTVGAIDINGFALVPPKTSALGQGLASYGLSDLSGDLHFKGGFDQASRTYIIDDSTINVRNAGIVRIESRISDIDADKFLSTPAARVEALASAKLAHFSIRLTNAGLMEKLVDINAQRSAKTADAVKAQWGQSTAIVWPRMVGNDANAVQTVSAIEKFIAAPKSITLSADPRGSPVNLNEIAPLLRSHELASRYTLTATQE
jgi:hypothetical protein